MSYYIWVPHRWDEFNAVFAERGWIAHRWMDASIVERALGDVAEAEALLVTYFSPDWVAAHLPVLAEVRAFGPRGRLAELALEDYRAARYHACVPVVLALLDGMVHEAGLRGFFRKGRELALWDAAAVHNSGLLTLKAVLDSQRPETVVEAIDVPYRNGIVHGMDLGYDNLTVAAKCWATLFAVADVVSRMEPESPI